MSVARLGHIEDQELCLPFTFQVIRMISDAKQSLNNYLLIHTFKRFHEKNLDTKVLVGKKKKQSSLLRNA